MNGARGETQVEIGGRARCLCLTLGALAEIETGLGCTRLDELEARLKRMSARDLMVVLSALLRGGGEVELAGRVAEEVVDLKSVAAAVGRAFEAALG